MARGGAGAAGPDWPWEETPGTRPDRAVGSGLPGPVLSSREDAKTLAKFKRIPALSCGTVSLRLSHTYVRTHNGDSSRAPARVGRTRGGVASPRTGSCRAGHGSRPSTSPQPTAHRRLD